MTRNDERTDRLEGFQWLWRIRVTKTLFSTASVGIVSGATK